MGFKEEAQENDDTLVTVVAMLCLWPRGLISSVSIHDELLACKEGKISDLWQLLAMIMVAAAALL